MACLAKNFLRSPPSRAWLHHRYAHLLHTEAGIPNCLQGCFEIGLAGSDAGGPRSIEGRRPIHASPWQAAEAERAGTAVGDLPFKMSAEANVRADARICVDGEAACGQRLVGDDANGTVGVP